MIFKKISVCFLGLTLCSNAFAVQEAKKIVFVDMQQIEIESLAITDLVKKLQAKQKSMQDQINEKAKDIDEQVKALEAKSKTLSRELFESSKLKLQEKALAFQQDMHKKNASLQEARTSALAEVDAKIREMVSNVASQKKYDLVLPTQSALYVNLDVYEDITKMIVNELNRKMATIDVSKYFNQKEDQSFDKLSRK